MAQHLFLFVLVNSLLFCLQEVDAIDTVILLPTLCGTTSMPLGCQIVQAHMGVSLGQSAYTQPVVNCTYVFQAAMPNQLIRFGVGTGEDEVNVIMHDMGCLGASMVVLDSNGDTLATLCDGTIDRSIEYLSTGDRITLVVNTMGGSSSILNFTAHFTSFNDGADCANLPDLFPCSNGRCVDTDGVCDTTLINNCGDFSDNSPGPPGNCSSEEETTTPTTLPPNATTTTSIPEAAAESEASNLWIIGAAGGGLVGAYLLYKLLWRPGYLVWRCSCWRHWCRSPAESAKTSNGISNDTKSKPPGDKGTSNSSEKSKPPTKGDKGTAMNYLSEPNNVNPSNGVSSFGGLESNPLSHNGPPGFSSGPNDLPSSYIHGITREAHIFR